MMSENKLHLIEMTAEIVAAYVEKHALVSTDLPELISEVHAALAGIATHGAAVSDATKPEPAVPIRKAVQPDYVVDLFTGKRFKSLKRHIRTTYNMSPDEYRAYWATAGLPHGRAQLRQIALGVGQVVRPWPGRPTRAHRSLDRDLGGLVTGGAEIRAWPA